MHFQCIWRSVKWRLPRENAEKQCIEETSQCREGGNAVNSIFIFINCESTLCIYVWIFNNEKMYFYVSLSVFVEKETVMKQL